MLFINYLGSINKGDEDVSPKSPVNSSWHHNIHPCNSPSSGAQRLCFTLCSGSEVFSEAISWLRLCVAEACSNESLLSFILIFKVCYYLEVFNCITFAKTSEQRPAYGNDSTSARFYINRKDCVQPVLFFASHNICL